MERRSILDRFLSFVVKTETCWWWRGAILPTGYGAFSLRLAGVGGSRRAHRVSWFLHKGQIPDGLCVLHRCDNRRCVNPDHLFLGTKRDNVMDMIEKGRQSRGSAHTNARLSESDIVDIRRRRASGEKVTDLAREFNVDIAHVSHIANGHEWVWLTDGLNLSRPSRGRVNADLVAELVSAWRGGERQCDIAERFNLSRSYINTIVRGRTKYLSREDCEHQPKGPGLVKLTAEQVAMIKWRLLKGERHRPIARDFGVSTSLVSYIKRGKVWTDIQPKAMEMETV